MNFTGEVKLANKEFLEKRCIFKSSSSELPHSAFKKCLMKQSLQTEALNGKILWFCRYGDSSLCCIKVGEADKVFVQYFLLRCIDFCIKM
jgi:hypothetical protein